MKPFGDKNSKFHKGQLSFDIEKPMENDRNHSLGGRSFYFFDFDENIAYLNTTTIIFNKRTKEEKYLSGKEFSIHSRQIGIKGLYKDYEIIANDQKGSFRHYRDRKIPKIFKLLGRKQSFVNDIKTTISREPFLWQGPSWSCFYHAVYNNRPLALITARGHSPETIKLGIKEMVNAGFLPHEPNYLTVLPVNYPPIKKMLLKNNDYQDVSQLKKRAIKNAFAKALKVYGDKPHRFGMSDDDKTNIKLITEAMKELKTDYSHLSFYVIETSEGQFIKKEINPYSKTDTSRPTDDEQLSLPFNHQKTRL